MCSGERGPTAKQWEWIAAVALRKRSGLLRAYRGMLRVEDLEECISQAVLELLLRARSGRPFASPLHVCHALEQKVRSRVTDRLRAYSGRSPLLAALERAQPLEPATALAGLIDPRPAVEEQVFHRELLERVVETLPALTVGQRAALAAALSGDGPAEGRSRERERKLCERARRSLRVRVLAGWDG